MVVPAVVLLAVALAVGLWPGLEYQVQCEQPAGLRTRRAMSRPFSADKTLEPR